MKDGVKHVPATQPSKSAPVADSTADKQKTSSSSFMFDGMSLSAVKMQSPQQKENSITSAVSTAAGTLEAVNKQNTAPRGTKQKETNGDVGSTNNLTASGDDPTSLSSQLPSQSTVTPVTPKVAVAAVAATATKAETDSTSSANKISDIDFEEEPSSLAQKSLLPSSRKEESEAKESKDPSRSSAPSKELAPSRQLRAALQPAYEQRGQVHGACVECHTFSQRTSSDPIQMHHNTYNISYSILYHIPLHPIL
jgi:hypothetical protein